MPLILERTQGQDYVGLADAVCVYVRACVWGLGGEILIHSVLRSH